MQEAPAHISFSSLVTDRRQEPYLLNESEDISDFLTGLGVSHRTSGHYWQVGEINRVQGWILHLTTIETQLSRIINLVVPILLEESIPFKIPRSKDIAQKLMYGSYGSDHLGKVICIYPFSDELTARLAIRLIALTKDFKGPAIPTDIWLGNIVYTRFGSFSPIWSNDQMGRPARHIYNENQELILDNYHIPFKFPPGIEWPFHGITAPVLPPTPKLINARYYPISIIRETPRGTVQKAIYFKKLWNIKACVLKQGRRYLWCDKFDRSVADRLEWQYQLCKHLAGTIPLPKVFDHFVENGDTYLAMEFVKGVIVDKWILNVYKGRAWFDLPYSDRSEITNILIQIIDIAQRIHEKGFVHRDITPGNFIVNRKKNVIPIDLELAWSYRTKTPSPPFQMGTPGFASPQQLDQVIPDVKDDVYALGAFIMEACTNVGPSKIFGIPEEDLRLSILFFTQDEELTEVIVACLKDDPNERPDLSTLRKNIFSLQKTALKQPSPTRIFSIDETRLRRTIQAGLAGLADPNMLAFSCWRSVGEDEDTFGSQEDDQTVNIGWHTGIAGPLWLVAVARSAGLDVTSCSDVYRHNWTYMHKYCLRDTFEAKSSLFYGSGGIALALSQGMTSGLLLSDDQNRTILKNCFLTTAHEISLSSGLSGQGLAMIYSAKWLESLFVQERLDFYVKELLDRQLLDGSWNTRENDSKGAKKEKISRGMNDGISGIIWFLLSYLQIKSDSQVMSAVEKSLNWVIVNKINQKNWANLQGGNAYHELSQGRKSLDTTMLMIKAFEVLQDPKYRSFAENNLTGLPDHLTLGNPALNSGMARIGELYLEAQRVFTGTLWQERASWITNYLLNTLVLNDGKQGYWGMASNQQFPTADLFKGTSGIIRYLIKYWKSGQLVYPI